MQKRAASEKTGFVGISGAAGAGNFGGQLSVFYVPFKSVRPPPVRENPDANANLECKRPNVTVHL